MTRATFLKHLTWAALLGPALGRAGLAGDALRGDRVGWARLKTPGEWWLRHANGDGNLTRFLREQTSLNIAPNWSVADVESLEQMIGYPLLFAQSLVPVTLPSAQANLVEYLRRGGFILVDACCNLTINPDHDAFLAQHVAYLRTVLPEAKVETLSPSHVIYRCLFPILNGHPPHSFFRNEYDARKARHGLYGIHSGDRMLGVVSLSGLQCGWSPMGVEPPPGHVVACLRMLVNIYAYAMTLAR